MRNENKSIEPLFFSRGRATVFGIPTNGQGPFFLTAQEQADIVAYMKLLK